MVDAKLLYNTVSEYEALDERRMNIQEEQKQLLKTAEEGGLEKKIVKRLITELRRDAQLMKAERDMLDAYRDAYAQWDATPLGAHAKGSAEPTDGVSQLKRARAKKGSSEAEQLDMMAKNAEDAAAAEAEVTEIKTAIAARAS